MAHPTLTAMGTLLRSSVWWRAQAWVLVTETLLGYLALVGYTRGISIAMITLGLAGAYSASWAVNFALLTTKRRYGMMWGALASVLTILTFVTPPILSWWILAFTVGVLSGFKDVNNINTTVWVPLHARRKGQNASFALRTSQMLSVVVCAFTLLFSAWMTTHTTYWLNLMLAVGVLVGVPDLLYRLQRSNTHKTRPVEQPHVSSIEWLSKVSSLFSSAHFIGRRLVLPLSFAFLAKQWGMDKQVIVWFGLALTIMSVVGILLRNTTSSKLSAVMLKRGLERTILGWLGVVMGVVLIPFAPAWLSLMMMVGGWCVVELAVRDWGAGFTDTLRLVSTHRHSRRSRAYREALNAVTMQRNKTVTSALVVASASLGHAPLMVGVLGVGCWYVFRTGRKTHLQHLSPSNQTKPNQSQPSP